MKTFEACRHVQSGGCRDALIFVFSVAVHRDKLQSESDYGTQQPTPSYSLYFMLLVGVPYYQ